MNSNKILSVEPDSPAFRTGLKPGDEIIEIDGNKVSDSIDLAFYSQDEEMVFIIDRRGRLLQKIVERQEMEGLGIELAPFKVKTCKNKCAFCFVAQLPKGMRKTLYVRDEDYRMSFLYGSYITLSNMTAEDKERIVGQRLSPLYVSVHTTNDEVRRRLLGNPNAAEIMKELQFFTKNKIKIHTQIVLCPGFNDGRELERTILDLRKLFPYVASIAVVPVGLTNYSKKKVNPVSKQDAEDALDIISKLQKKFLKKHGEHVVFAADELYLRAGIKFPHIRDYGELPQLENGVGLVPLFLSESERFDGPAKKPTTPVVTFTGMSFYPFLKRFALRLRKKTGVELRVIPVENLFFGPSVTVTGLLTGRDVVRALIDQVKEGELLFVPDVVLRDEGDVFLDDIQVGFLEEVLKVRVKVVESTFDGLITALEESD